MKRRKETFSRHLPRACFQKLWLKLLKTIQTLFYKFSAAAGIKPNTL